MWVHAETGAYEVRILPITFPPRVSGLRTYVVRLYWLPPDDVSQKALYPQLAVAIVAATFFGVVLAAVIGLYATSPCTRAYFAYVGEPPLGWRCFLRSFEGRVSLGSLVLIGLSVAGIFLPLPGGASSDAQAGSLVTCWLAVGLALVVATAAAWALVQSVAVRSNLTPGSPPPVVRAPAMRLLMAATAALLVACATHSGRAQTTTTATAPPLDQITRDCNDPDPAVRQRAMRTLLVESTTADPGQRRDQINQAILGLFAAPDPEIQRTMVLAAAYSKVGGWQPFPADPDINQAEGRSAYNALEPLLDNPDHRLAVAAAREMEQICSAYLFPRSERLTEFRRQARRFGKDQLKGLHEGSPQELEVLADLLTDPSRSSACNAPGLLMSRGHAGRMALIAALSDPDPEVRNGALDGVKPPESGYSSDQFTTPELRKAASKLVLDSDPTVREQAMILALSLGDEGARALADAFAHGPPEVQPMAEKYIQQCREGRGAILGLLDDPDATVRARVLKVFQGLPRLELTFKKWREMLHDPDESVHDAAADLIVRLGPTGPGRLDLAAFNELILLSVGRKLNLRATAEMQLRYHWYQVDWPEKRIAPTTMPGQLGWYYVPTVPAARPPPDVVTLPALPGPPNQWRTRVLMFLAIVLVAVVLVSVTRFYLKMPFGGPALPPAPLAAIPVN